VLAAVGDLQFEVATERLRREFGVEVTLDPALPYDRARPVPAHGVPELAAVSGVQLLYRPDGEAVALFPDRWKLHRTREQFPHLFDDEHPIT
jgi:peptide chain release factor 3